MAFKQCYKDFGVIKYFIEQIQCYKETLCQIDTFEHRHSFLCLGHTDLDLVSFRHFVGPYVGMVSHKHDV